MNVNLKNKLWKYATLCVVVGLIFNPEMIGLGLFIDAIGLDIFLMLLEVQVLVMLSAIINSKIKPILEFIISCYVRFFPLLTWKNIKESPESLALAVPSQATVMYLLVFSAAVGIALNGYK